jgi:hypothetical protein
MPASSTKIICGGANIRIRPGGDGVQYLEAFSHNFGANSVSGDNGEINVPFHANNRRTVFRTWDGYPTIWIEDHCGVPPD